MKVDNVDEWLAAVLAFEEDPTCPDPYQRPKSGKLALGKNFSQLLITFTGISEAEIRLQLAEEGDSSASDRLNLHDVSPSALIALLLDFEDQQ